MTSRRDPQREAQRILGGFELKEGLLAVVFGASLLALLEELKKQQKSSGGSILLIEADPLLQEALVKAAPELFEGLYFAEAAPGGFDFLFDELNIERISGYRIFSSAGSMAVDPAFYGEMEGLFKKSFASRLSDLFTRFEFEPRWIYNALSNLAALHKGAPVSSLYKLFQNSKTPQHAILVSTGPSLRASLPFLKENRDRYFIACVDSAYRVLLRSGITPHLVISLDSQSFTARHFAGLERGKPGEFPILYADMVANPQAVLRWQGPLFLGVTATWRGENREVTPGCDFVEEKIIGASLGDIQSGGSVATSLFDLLRLMGFASVTLIGQDLGYTNMEIHTTGTHHTDAWLSGPANRLNPIENINYAVLKKRHINYETSLSGNPVGVDYILGLYRHWFEEAAQMLPGFIYNGSSDGAKIEGVEEGVAPSQGVDLSVLQKQLRQSAPVLKDSGVVKELYQKICDIPLETIAQNNGEFTFMERIGRKHAVRYLRQKMKEPSTEREKYLKMEVAERRAFWRKLQKMAKIGRRLL